MIFNITLILVFQLAGEVMARLFAIPVPGPVIGMGLLLIAFVLAPKLANRVVPTAQNILTHLSLLFVPAGVGVISHVEVLGQDGLALFAALFLSTVLALGAGVLTFIGLARLTGTTAERAE
ncbi:CidA/LrgA family protein [Roseovarius aestuariivivens]|uniref:CidA/LrgA family protein n=1 Tax=Roseovarius aestuariivivens TaxID=1888910 RepID=UPI0010815BD0|nr:CidA/LrgA family protein [Roseovarius aestuariivivens]